MHRVVLFDEGGYEEGRPHWTGFRTQANNPNAQKFPFIRSRESPQ